jgi:hypothetical protein
MIFDVHFQRTATKKLDQGCRKDHRIPEFSDVVSSTLPSPTPAEVVHGQSHPSQLPPPGRADSPPLTNRPYGHHNPYPSAASITASYRAQSVSPVHGQSQPCAASVAVQLRNTATPPTNTGLQRPLPAGDLRK